MIIKGLIRDIFSGGGARLGGTKLTCYGFRLLLVNINRMAVYVSDIKPRCQGRAHPPPRLIDWSRINEKTYVFQTVDRSNTVARSVIGRRI